jgi:hypothetical protein
VTVNAIPKGALDTGLKWNVSGGILKISGAGPIPDFVKYDAAPWNSLWKNITAIEVGNEVTAIGNYGFFGMEAATAVTIGNKVEFIGNAAFTNNLKLKTIHLPASVKTIGGKNLWPYYAFEYCDALTSFTVDANNTAFTAINGVLYTKDNTMQLLTCPVTKTSLSIPDTVTLISGRGVQRCKQMTTLSIPASVVTIGNFAFDLCTALTQITVSWTKPPALGGVDIFNNITVANITLKVPKGTSAAYKAHTLWKDFKIVE